MANIRDAVDQVKGLARIFQSVIDLADAVDAITSVENAVSEANIKLSAVDALVKAAEERLLTLNTESASTIEHNETLTATAKQTAIDLVANAQAKADQLDTTAHAKIAVLIADQENHSAALAEKATTLEIRSGNATLELADLESKLADARAKIADLLGR